MEAHASPIKATPGRRRHPRGGKPAPLKNYASENDAASYAASAHHHMAPQTPKKILSASTAPADHHNNQPGSKQRNRSHKPKGKTDPASPNYNLSSSQSPPRTSPTTKATPGAAFAGATFHASPAPSDLPIPSFLKSSSESPMVRKPRGVFPQPSPPATDSEVPTPYRPVSASQHRESPLDFMFRAHREEKARQDFDGTPVGASFLSGVMSPPRHLDAPLPLSPAASNLSRDRRTYSRQPSSGAEIFELDGSGGQPLGPAFSTPYQDRIKAARNNAPHPPASQGNPLPTPNSNASGEDPTEALKRFLFTPQSTTSTAPSSFNNASMPPRHVGSFSNSQIDGSGYDSAGSIQAMENDLRRILKLDLVTERPPTERRLFTH